MAAYVFWRCNGNPRSYSRPYWAAFRTLRQAQVAALDFPDCISGNEPQVYYDPMIDTRDSSKGDYGDENDYPMHGRIWEDVLALQNVPVMHVSNDIAWEVGHAHGDSDGWVVIGQKPDLARVRRRAEYGEPILVRLIRDGYQVSSGCANMRIVTPHTDPNYTIGDGYGNYANVLERHNALCEILDACSYRHRHGSSPDGWVAVHVGGFNWSELPIGSPAIGEGGRIIGYAFGDTGALLAQRPTECEPAGL